MEQYLEKLYSGRISRKNYVLGLLFFFVLDLLILIVISLLNIPLVYFLFWFASLVFVFALHVRRFHDIGGSTWQVLLLFIPIVNFLIFIFYLLLTSGEENDNKYGNPPKGKKFFNDVFRY